MKPNFIYTYANILSRSWDEYLRTTSYVIDHKEIFESNLFWVRYKIIPDIAPRAGWKDDFIKGIQ